MDTKERRLEMGLSVESLSEKLGVHPPLLMTWEQSEIACLQFSTMLESALNWIEYEMTRLTDEEFNETCQKVEAALESSGKLL
jgi:transcriptional regulator with XRE-family HTH domain